MQKIVRISEQQFKKITVENKNQYKKLLKEDDLQHQLQGLLNLIKSGDKENIDMAFEIAQGLNIPESMLFEPFIELFEFLKHFKQITSKIINKYALFEMQNIDMLALRGEKIRRLPEAIVYLKSLEFLLLQETLIATLPKDIGNLTNLQWIDLKKTHIRKLPESIYNLTKIEWINIERTNINYEEYQKIKQRMPNTKIEF